jgi:hypothetical protein
MRAAEDYGRLTAFHAQAAEDEKLQAVSLLDTGIIYCYVDTPRCIATLEEGLELARTSGTQVHESLGQASLLAARLLLDHNDVSLLRGYSDQAIALIETCIHHDLCPNIPRVYLLLGAIHYLLSVSGGSSFSMANRYVTLGIDAALKYNTGYVLWQLYNLSGVLKAQEGFPKDDVFKAFSTAVEHLRLEDMLFLGNLDFCNANLVVVSNYIRFLDLYETERTLYRFLDELRFYRDSEYRSKEGYAAIIESVRKDGILLQAEKHTHLPIDKVSGFIATASF